MALTSEQWLEVCRSVVPPLLTGVVGIAAVLVTQFVQRKGERSHRRAEQRREDLRTKVDALTVVVTSILGAEVLGLFCVGSRRTTMSFADNLVNAFNTGTKETDSAVGWLRGANMKGLVDR